MNLNESFDRTASHMAGEYVSNAEPVAYVYQNFGIGRVAWLTEVPPDGTKLYTHPIKELTDKEIKDLWCEVYDFKGYDCLTELDYKFCREILRKAQEK
jgi:hypothetical protein